MRANEVILCLANDVFDPIDTAISQRDHSRI
jgi:hypothetical protein